MSSKIDARLAELGLTLPKVSVPQANYVPTMRTGNLVFTAGQVPVNDGKIEFTGKVGADCSIETGYEAAKLCGLNVLAQLKAALDGDLDRVVRFVKVVGFVNSTLDFVDHPKIINGASDLFVNVFGEAGKHARSAIGVASLPWGVAAEVEVIVEVR